jgi:DNA-binding response OmpR family regulator
MHVVLVEDNPQDAKSITHSLGEANFEVRHFGEPHALFRALPDLEPSLFIFDWLLPGSNGGDVLRRTRALFGSSMPMMVLTNEFDETVAVNALDSGADDFVSKPVSTRLLQARVNALLRRQSGSGEARQDTIEMGPYRLCRNHHQLVLGGESLHLTAKEFALSWLLFGNPHRFISHAEISACIWGNTPDCASHTVSQHVYLLRKKLNLARHGFRLTSVYGAGYRFDPPAESA